MTCPVAYDHNDDLDKCECCGWTGAEAPPMKPERVMLVGLQGQEWEADIIERLPIGCCIVVRFTGRTPYPGPNNPATICTSHLREVRAALTEATS